MYSRVDTEEDEASLPTIGFFANLVLECSNEYCLKAATRWRRICGHSLNIAHQKMGWATGGYIAYQAILWHGGEAVFIKGTKGQTLEDIQDEVLEWLDKVHQYNTLPPKDVDEGKSDGCDN